VKVLWARLQGFDKNTECEKQYEQLTLTADGVFLLAKYCPEAIPDLSEEQINDQSKTNGVAKFLVCVQALWFCIQCISRLSFGLSISLLELNTFGHSICALMLAFLWWKKPLDVAQPTLISIKGDPKYEEEMSRLCAFMCMASALDDQLEFDLFKLEREYYDKRKVQIPYKCPLPVKPTAFPGRDLEEIIETIPSSSRLSDRHLQPDGTLVIWDGETVYGFTLRSQRIFSPPYSCKQTRASLQLRQVDQTRWKLASEAIERHRWYTLNERGERYLQMNSWDGDFLWKIWLRRELEIAREAFGCLRCP
jgi:hypothetical protein